MKSFTFKGLADQAKAAGSKLAAATPTFEQLQVYRRSGDPRLAFNRLQFCLRHSNKHTNSGHVHASSAIHPDDGCVACHSLFQHCVHCRSTRRQYGSWCGQSSFDSATASTSHRSAPGAECAAAVSVTNRATEGEDVSIWSCGPSSSARQPRIPDSTIRKQRP